VLTYTKEQLHPGEEQVFTAGQGGPTLEAGEATVALAICPDMGHPEQAASAAARKANVYAGGVLIIEKGYTVAAALLEQYAREHKMAVLIANHSAPTGGWIPAGRSTIWSGDGKLVVASAETEEALVVGRKKAEVGTVLCCLCLRLPATYRSQVRAHEDRTRTKGCRPNPRPPERTIDGPRFTIHASCAP
jgi:predicted amidohydrolase